MNVEAEVSLYPLRTKTLLESIDRFLESLRRRKLDVRPGNMSTQVYGECGAVFDALRDSFALAAATDDVVLTVKISNACPHCAEREASEKP